MILFELCLILKSKRMINYKEIEIEIFDKSRKEVRRCDGMIFLKGGSYGFRGLF
jgi:hypothetical protein